MFNNVSLQAALTRLGHTTLPTSQPALRSSCACKLQTETTLLGTKFIRSSFPLRPLMRVIFLLHTSS